MSNTDENTILENELLIKQAVQELFRRLRGKNESALDKEIFAAVVSVFKLAGRGIETIINFESFLSLVRDKVTIEQNLIDDLYQAVKEAKGSSQHLLPFIEAVPNFLPEYLTKPEHATYGKKLNPKKEIKLAQKVYFEMQAVFDTYTKQKELLYEEHLKKLDALDKEKEAEYERTIAEREKIYKEHISKLQLIYEEREKSQQKANEEQMESHKSEMKKIINAYEKSIASNKLLQETHISKIKDFYEERENKIRLLLSERSEKGDDVAIFCRSLLEKLPNLD